MQFLYLVLDHRDEIITTFRDRDEAITYMNENAREIGDVMVSPIVERVVLH